MNTCRRANRVVISLFVAFCAGLTVSRGALADITADLEGFAWSEVQAPDLAQTRGKYIAPGRVSYFGIQMYSQWETGQGERYNGGIALQIDVSEKNPAGFPARVDAFVLGQLTEGEWRPGRGPLSGSSTGLDNVEGVAQGILVGGNGNRVRNDTEINVSFHSGRNPRNESDRQQIRISGSGTASVNGAAGGTTTATIAENGIGIAIEVPGQGRVVQQIQGSSGLQQTVKVNSDFNTIRNTLALEVGRQMPGGALGIDFPALQESLRGLPPF